MATKINEQAINAAVSMFDFTGTFVSHHPLGNGHINNTFLVKCITDDKKEICYVLQAINSEVFKRPDFVMDNIAKVTSFLKEKMPDSSHTMSFVLTKDGSSLYHDSFNNYWRMYEYITDSICLELPETTKDFYESAYAFGEFQRYLNDFPAEELYETIPDFHNTPKRYKDFLEAVENNVSSRAEAVKDEIEFVKSREKFYSVLFDENKAGNLPIRVTHNDTKMNNVMLNKTDRKALCVIDLDTIMPGFSVTDFGDAIRFGASTAAEDEPDISKVQLNLEMFDIYTKGFLDGCGGMLSKEEIMLLPEGAKMMTIECGMRFLGDYLNGDTYFKINYPEHNLVRCHTQFKLVEEMEKHWDEMKQIVKKYI